MWREAKTRWAVGMLVAAGLVGVVGWAAWPVGLFIDGRPKSAEARINLKTLVNSGLTRTDARAAFDGRVIEFGNRYAYFVSLEPDGSIPIDARYTQVPLAQLRAALPADLGPHGTCPDDCWVVVAAVANLDADATLDVWSLSSRDRRIDGELVKAGTAYRHVDDEFEPGEDQE